VTATEQKTDSKPVGYYSQEVKYPDLGLQRPKDRRVSSEVFGVIATCSRSKLPDIGVDSRRIRPRTNDQVKRVVIRGGEVVRGCCVSGGCTASDHMQKIVGKSKRRGRRGTRGG
jgi:hypothetical protein